MPASTPREPSASRITLSRPPQLQLFREGVEDDPDVLALLVLGSVARGDHDGRSDVDLVALVTPRAGKRILAKLEGAVAGKFPQRLAFPEKNKTVFYSSDATQKVDVFIVEALQEVSKYVAGSRIPNPDDGVLFDKTGTVSEWMRNLAPEIDDLDVVVPREVTRFVYHFERASALHAVNDMYRARYNLEIALHCVAHLEWRAAGQAAFAWLPRKLIVTAPDEVAEALRKYEAPMDPSRFHPAKQHLLGMFQRAVNRLGRNDNGAVAFCQRVLLRDRWYHHRDSAAYTSDGLARGVLLRGSSPHRFASDPDYLAWLSENKVAIRVDLRGAHEKRENPIVGLPVETIEVPIDPWNNFPKDDPLHDGVSPSEASYRFSALKCPHALRAVIEAVATAPGAVLVHCYAGVDRTGVVVALAQLLAGATMNEVLAGYSANSNEERTGYLARTLALVDERGGVEALAREAGISESQLADFRARMRA